MQTVTRTIETEAAPDLLYRFLAQASNIPRWAPAFADAVKRVSNERYCVTKNDQPFDLEVVLHPSARAVDYLRSLPQGKRGGAYIRVTELPSGGSTVTMTLPIAPGATDTTVAKTLEQELADLVRIALSDALAFVVNDPSF